MSDEIKEILDFDFASQGERIDINEYERDILKDYITNLQQENERLKKLEYKFFYCSEDEENFTLEDYLELGNKVYDLEQENERLKVNCNLGYEELKVARNYKSRCEKAVEYVKTIQESEKNINPYILHAPTLLNILQGGKDE